MKDKFMRKAWVKRVVDGDTLELEIDLGWNAVLTHHVRLASVNTPEIRGVESEAGKYVRDVVINLLEWEEDSWPGVIIRSLKFETGKFGRCICRVYFGPEYSPECLNDILLERGLAWPTDDDGSLLESRDLWNLKGIPEPYKKPKTLFSPIYNFLTK